MSLPILLAAAEAPSPLNLVLTGFFFVVIVLSLLATMTWLGGRFFASRDAAQPSLSKKTVKAPKANPAASAATASAADEGELAAVITAAIHMTLQDHRIRVRSIRRMAPGWAQEGRRQIFSSHRLR